MGQRVDVVGDDAPDGEIVVGGNADRRVLGVVGDEPRATVGGVASKLLDSKLAVDESRHEIAVARFERTVDNNDVAIEDTRVLHAVACNTGVERAFGVSHHLSGEVD